jgi:transcriptional regulator with XRE-family HTH domain
MAIHRSDVWGRIDTLIPLLSRMMSFSSVKKLADALGITFQQVQKYETGINRMGGSRLHHLVATLQVPLYANR